MMQNEVVDHDARRDAALANQKIDAHEDKCAERWREARDATAALVKSIEGLSQRIWWGVGGVIAFMSAVILWLLDRAA